MLGQKFCKCLIEKPIGRQHYANTILQAANYPLTMPPNKKTRLKSGSLKIFMNAINSILQTHSSGSVQSFVPDALQSYGVR